MCLCDCLSKLSGGMGAALLGDPVASMMERIEEGDLLAPGLWLFDRSRLLRMSVTIDRVGRCKKDSAAAGSGDSPASVFGDEE